MLFGIAHKRKATKLYGKSQIQNIGLTNPDEQDFECKGLDIYRRTWASR